MKGSSRPRRCHSCECQHASTCSSVCYAVGFFFPATSDQRLQNKKKVVLNCKLFFFFLLQPSLQWLVHIFPLRSSVALRWRGTPQGCVRVVNLYTWQSLNSRELKGKSIEQPRLGTHVAGCGNVASWSTPKQHSGGYGLSLMGAPGDMWTGLAFL